MGTDGDPCLYDSAATDVYLFMDGYACIDDGACADGDKVVEVYVVSDEVMAMECTVVTDGCFCTYAGADVNDVTCPDGCLFRNTCVCMDSVEWV